MLDWVLPLLETLAAGISLVLMGLCGVKLLMRFVAVLRGREEAAPVRYAGASLQEMLAAAGVTLLSRLLLYVLAYAMYRLLRVGTDGFFDALAPLWTHWDTRHYIGIAQEGYTAVGDERLRLVFFPLYPLLMRLLSPLTGGNVFAAGLVISLLCASVASALLYDLAAMHMGRRAAVRAVSYFLLSPLSVFLCCAYTEALFICLTLAAVCLLRRGRPYLAALCGMGSAFTRMPGVIVAGLILIALLSRIPQKQLTWRTGISCAAQMCIVFCGLVAYWMVNWVVTGDPMTYLTYQRENWFQQPGSFWGSTANTVHYFFSTVGDGDWLFTWGFQLLCMGVIYLMMAFCTDGLPFDLAAYSFVYVAVVLSPTWLLSGARYLYALCTFPLMLSGLRIGRCGHGVLMALSGAMLVLWTFGYTIAIQVL